MPEKLRIYRAFRYASAIDGKIFRVFACAVLVYDFRYGFLADTALARDKDGQVCESRPVSEFHGIIQGRIIADDVETALDSL